MPNSMNINKLFTYFSTLSIYTKFNNKYLTDVPLLVNRKYWNESSNRKHPIETQIFFLLKTMEG